MAFLIIPLFYLFFELLLHLYALLPSLLQSGLFVKLFVFLHGMVILTYLRSLDGCSWTLLW
ncbi:MAG: hypothetical protein M0Q91_18780 [Methanoregula sp.]|nr:hypothetical protein [Methanoregula sp.]